MPIYFYVLFTISYGAISVLSIASKKIESIF